jgi:hypothetical protein
MADTQGPIFPIDREMAVLAETLKTLAGDFTSAAIWLESASKSGINNIDNPKYLRNGPWAINRVLRVHQEIPLFWERLEKLRNDLEALQSKS